MYHAAQAKKLASAFPFRQRLNTIASILCCRSKERKKESKKEPSQGKETLLLDRKIKNLGTEIVERGEAEIEARASGLAHKRAGVL
jgi:hypothetical protein